MRVTTFSTWKKRSICHRNSCHRNSVREVSNSGRPSAVSSIRSSGWLFFLPRPVASRSDGLSLLAIEPKFHAEMFRLMDLDPGLVERQMDRKDWPRIREVVAERLRTRTRDEWTGILGGSDACFAPVLGMDEVTGDPHLQARKTFIELDGVVQPAPAPRFSRTPSPEPTPPVRADMVPLADALDGWLPEDEIREWEAG